MEFNYNSINYIESLVIFQLSLGFMGSWLVILNVISESDIQDQVEGSLDMPSTYETVVARAQLALVSKPS